MYHVNSLPQVKELSKVHYRLIYSFYPHGKKTGERVYIYYSEFETIAWIIYHAYSQQKFETLTEALSYAIKKTWLSSQEAKQTENIIKSRIGG